MTAPMPELIDEGLQLQAVIPVGALDDDTSNALTSLGLSLTDWSSLVLTGQGGSRLWEKNVRHNLHRADPFDETSVDLIRRWFDAHEPDASWTVVYPSNAALPLGRLAETVGWGTPSPLGLTINAEFGLWMSHRVAFVTTASFAPTDADAPPSPCLTCDGRPCQTACPVGAVSLSDGFDVRTCAEFRISQNSPCAHECLARNVCPVGPQHRYGPAQMRHHYGSGLASIQAWLKPE